MAIIREQQDIHVCRIHGSGWRKCPPQEQKLNKDHKFFFICDINTPWIVKEGDEDKYDIYLNCSCKLEAQALNLFNFIVDAQFCDGYFVLYSNSYNIPNATIVIDVVKKK